LPVLLAILKNISAKAEAEAEAEAELRVK